LGVPFEEFESWWKTDHRGKKQDSLGHLDGLKDEILRDVHQTVKQAVQDALEGKKH